MNYGQKSHIQDLIESGEATLEAVLDDSDIINEVQLGNKRVTEL